MKYGIEMVNLGPWADPRVVVELAQAAEAAGWESVFVCDHLGFVWGVETADPFVTLAAVATATARIKIGVDISPLPRYKPHVLAQTLTTLDILSQGRVVFGVGLGGVEREYTAFGENGDHKTHASMVDEGLSVLTRLWSGEKVVHHGQHYTVDGVTLRPLPVQRPRIPLWIGGESKPALRRAAHWDGWIIGCVNQDGSWNKTPEQVAEKISSIKQQRVNTAPFDFVIDGRSEPTDPSMANAFKAAGATWWLECLLGTFDAMLNRVLAGPPR